MWGFFHKPFNKDLSIPRIRNTGMIGSVRPGFFRGSPWEPCRSEISVLGIHWWPVWKPQKFCLETGKLLFNKGGGDGWRVGEMIQQMNLCQGKLEIQVVLKVIKLPKMLVEIFTSGWDLNHCCEYRLGDVSPPTYITYQWKLLSVLLCWSRCSQRFAANLGDKSMDWSLRMGGWVSECRNLDLIEINKL